MKSVLLALTLLLISFTATADSGYEVTPYGIKIESINGNFHDVYNETIERKGDIAYTMQRHSSADGRNFLTVGYAYFCTDKSYSTTLNYGKTWSNPEYAAPDTIGRIALEYVCTYSVYSKK